MVQRLPEIPGLAEAPSPGTRGSVAAETIEQHRACLKWLLRFGRAIYLTAADPDYPDKRLSSELRGRLIQLEHSWRMVHERLPESEASQLLQEIFPE